MKILECKVGGVSDTEILEFFGELRKVTHVDYQTFSDTPVLSFLIACLHPLGGTSKPVKIDKRKIEDVADLSDFLLLKRVGEIQGGLHGLLVELLVRRSRHVDHFTGTKVYMLLNQTLIESKKRDPNRFWQNWSGSAGN